MSTWHGDWANRQEPVYNTSGAVVGCVAQDGPNWVAASWDGKLVTRWSTRRQAEMEVLRVAKYTEAQHHPSRRLAAPVVAQQPDVSLEQMAGAFVAGAALLGAMGAFFGVQEQPAKASDQAEDLRRQNEELRRQNDLLRQALNGMGPQGLARRK